MRGEQARIATLADGLRLVRELSAKTVVLDVEPLVAYWDSSQRSLDQGIAQVLSEIAEVRSVVAVCFATNSARRPSADPAYPGIRVTYLASAYKPFRVDLYRDLPKPGVLIGDQVLTDGLLARASGLRLRAVHHGTGKCSAPALAAGSGRAPGETAAIQATALIQAAGHITRAE